MCSFDSSMSSRISEGWEPIGRKDTGFTFNEVEEFLELEEEIELK